MEPRNSGRSPDVSKVSSSVVETVTPLGLGELAPFQVEKTEHSTRVRIFWRRVIVWLLLGVCSGWLVLSGGIYAFVKYRRGFTDVKYTQIFMLPLGMGKYRHSKGEFLIRQGMAKIEAQDWRAAFPLLRAGLVDAPEHEDARLWLARIYLMAGRSDAAADLLEDGLKIHDQDLDYLRTVLGFFFGLQADKTVIAFTSELGRTMPPGTPAFRMVHTALAYAYFNRGLYAEALQALASSDLSNSPEGHFVAARIDWERGKHQAALDQMRKLVRQVPDDLEIYRTLIYYLGQSKLWDEVQQVSLIRELNFPDKPDSYLDYINACREKGDTDNLQKCDAEYLKLFSKDAYALERLAEQAAEHGEVGLAEKVWRQCHILGQRQAEVSLLWVTSMLKDKDYKAADSLVTKLAVDGKVWSGRNLVILNGLRSVALYGLGQPLAAEPLASRLEETSLVPAQTLVLLAEQLEQIGHQDIACKIYRHAVELDSLNQPALASLLRLLLVSGKLEETPELFSRLLDMRKPPDDLIDQFWQMVRSDRYLFWSQRDTMIRQIEQYRQRRAAALAG